MRKERINFWLQRTLGLATGGRAGRLPASYHFGQLRAEWILTHRTAGLPPTVSLSFSVKHPADQTSRYYTDFGISENATIMIPAKRGNSTNDITGTDE